ncbi:protein phosphatase regulator [Coemansia sp. RSA 552]|nr:protein phosphatase regulator [Coemansia sp. RSA 552]
MNFQGLEFDGVPTDSDLLSDNDSVSSLVDEDVDYDYVYALYHFPQMVEGQVTVEEGEKLTLLDDSNSYWWLVQNLRDNQMGYIPADNIETALGKLARVNRRKNLKLCKPDPEHMLSTRGPDADREASRRVQFNDALVTQVFISSPPSEADDDDDDGYDDGYDDAYDEQYDGELHAEEPHVNEPQADAAHDSDSDDHYSYYYGTDSASHDATPAAGRRVSITPMTMGGIAGDLESGTESGSASDSEDHGVVSLYGAPARRESALLTHGVGTVPGYYASNDDSDDGDSLSGVLNRYGETSSPEPGKYSLRVQHGASSAEIAMFRDELLGEVLGRALAAFGLEARLSSTLTLYARFGPHDISVLPAESTAAALLDRLRARVAPEPFAAGGEIDAALCSLVMADRSAALAQLLDREPAYDSSPAQPASVASSEAASPQSSPQTSPRLAPLASSTAARSEESLDEAPPVKQSPSKGPPGKALPTGDLVADPAETEDADVLPDSRLVVQGLLRSIPPPASQPPQSAINRAKRNTVQITQPAPTEPALGHSASTLRPSSDTFDRSGEASPAMSSDTVSSHHDDDTPQPAAASAALATLASSPPHGMDDDESPPDELPLDDWLLVLRGWADSSDIPPPASAGSVAQAAIDEILRVSQSAGRRLDAVERDLDDLARVLVHAT